MKTKTKVCPSCRKRKKVTDFYIGKAYYKDGVSYCCKDCIKCRSVEYGCKHREEVVERSRRRRLNNKKIKAVKVKNIYVKLKTKVCTKCGKRRKIKYFYKNKVYVDGYTSRCESCLKIINKKWQQVHAERINKCARDRRICSGDKIREVNRTWCQSDKGQVSKKKFLKKHKEQVRKWGREYGERHKNERSVYGKKWREENRERYTAKTREWAKKNPDKVRKHVRDWIERNKKDPYYRMVDALRHRTSQAIRKGHKSAKTLELLGCTLDELKQHLSKQFKKGMDFNNYGRTDCGKKVWNIDHIRPVSSFNLTKSSEQRKCFHYTNLQPLWAAENISKGAKYELQDRCSN